MLKKNEDLISIKY